VTTTAVPARIRWALELLDVQPDDRLLELGCGRAINVNVFWTRSPAPELARIARLLAPGGLLPLVYEVPSAARATAIAETVRPQLVSAGFGGVREVGSPPAVRHGVGVVATGAAKDASPAPRRPRPRSRRGRGT
jgi:hypothetical protein